MVKSVTGSFNKVGIYGCVRDEKRKLEATLVARDVAGGGRKLPKTAAHFLLSLHLRTATTPAATGQAAGEV